MPTEGISSFIHTVLAGIMNRQHALFAIGVRAFREGIATLHRGKENRLSESGNAGVFGSDLSFCHGNLSFCR
ncbi:hypothetical protein, partial [Tannerella sp.]|uniref:hypothetical protein n=1 Tax=Tannerella sp. TaxID=2382127 RepID=UPI0026DD8F7A